MKTVNTMSASPSHIKWSEIEWTNIERYVRKLRQRIFRAEKLGQSRKVRKLQRLMLRSRANLLLSIKKVTQINKGKRTAGVDGYRVSRQEEREQLYEKLKTRDACKHRPKPARRINIPKKNGKLRPLGIPTIKYRVYQNIVRNALEPQWEYRFEGCSYGFRPKRSTQDAITNLFLKLHGRTTKKWVFEGDFKGCFGA